MHGYTDLKGQNDCKNLKTEKLVPLGL